MKIALRLECPHCKWGVPWHDSFVNMGWIEMSCAHCDETFFTKITITGFNVETSKELPINVPCQNMPNEAVQKLSDSVEGKIR